MILGVIDVGTARLSGQLPTFDTDAPADPSASAHGMAGLCPREGVSQPHAMSIATVSAEVRHPLASLLLKDVRPTACGSPPRRRVQRRDLAQNPRAAPSYWREQGRQIRVVGDVEPGSRARPNRLPEAAS
jgi:pyridoxine/pyridoxamine 5'-phosphate oxidase